MAELYTSLDVAKATLLNGRAPVAHTPLPPEAQLLIDPALVLGLGALYEDHEKGLLCPVKGCGSWQHDLSQHLTKTHAEIGGVSAVRKALSIPKGVKLSSRSLLAKRRETRAALVRDGRIDVDAQREILRRARESRTPETFQRVGRTRSDIHCAVVTRNKKLRCAAQIRERISRLAAQIRRTPGVSDVKALDLDLYNASMEVYRTWGNALAQAGMSSQYGPGKSSWNRLTVEDVLTALRAWYEQNGRLPIQDEVQYQSKAPILPGVHAIKRALDAESWPEAMRRAAALLGIEGGRYGLPKKESAA